MKNRRHWGSTYVHFIREGRCRRGRSHDPTTRQARQAGKTQNSCSTHVPFSLRRRKVFSRWHAMERFARLSKRILARFGPTHVRHTEEMLGKATRCRKQARLPAAHLLVAVQARRRHEVVDGPGIARTWPRINQTRADMRLLLGPDAALHFGQVRQTNPRQPIMLHITNARGAPLHIPWLHNHPADTRGIPPWVFPRNNNLITQDGGGPCPPASDVCRPACP